MFHHVSIMMFLQLTQFSFSASGPESERHNNTTSLKSVPPRKKRVSYNRQYRTTVREAGALANKNKLPKRLYKYRSMKPASRDFTESIFKKNQVWYAQSSTFNDPFDCNHYIDLNRSSDEWRTILRQFEQKFSQAMFLVPGLLIQALWNAGVERYNKKAEGTSRRKLPKLTKEKLRKVTRNIGEQSEMTLGGRTPSDLVADKNVGAKGLNELLNRYFEKSKQAVDQHFGVFCLAQQPDNILMWSHYADEHAGICIEFDTAAHANVFHNIQPVEYKVESPVIEKRFANILMEIQDEERSFDEEILEHIAGKDVDEEWTDRDIHSWFLTKSTLWKYENEWRSIVSVPGPKQIPAAAISGVIIGCKASDETEQAVRDLVSRRRRKVSIYRAQKKKGTFALDIVPI